MLLQAKQLLDEPLLVKQLIKKEKQINFRADQTGLQYEFLN